MATKYDQNKNNTNRYSNAEGSNIMSVFPTLTDKELQATKECLKKGELVLPRRRSRTGYSIPSDHS